jgi:hypothetical protein
MREILSSTTRGQAGVVVSFSSDDGDRRTRVMQGAQNQLEALRVLCRRADGWDGRWYVESVSTPQTVYSDVKGGSRGDVSRDGETRGAMIHERQMLGRINRLDMLRIPELDTRNGRDSGERPGHAWRRLYGRYGVGLKRKW